VFRVYRYTTVHTADVHGSLYGPYTGAVYGPCTRPFTACVYVEFTARVHSLIHLRVCRPCTWICLRSMYTGRPCLRPVHTPVYMDSGRVRAMYTAACTTMYRPCPRPCTSGIHVRGRTCPWTRPCTRPFTRAVSSAVRAGYGLHGRVRTVYTRPYLAGPCILRTHGRGRPGTRPCAPPYYRPGTGLVHGRVQYTAPVHVHVRLRVHGQHRYCNFYSTNNNKNKTTTRIRANAKRDGCPAEYRWRPLFNAAKFG